jgi:hypothetical protein
MNMASSTEEEKNPFIDIFKQALFAELYVYHLFGKETREYYLFRPHETGDSVWLVPGQAQGQNYEPRQFKDDAKRQPRVIPRVRIFEDYVPFDKIMLEDRIPDIKKMVREGGEDLAQRVNQCFVDVLKTSALNSRMQIQQGSLQEFLAQVADGLADKGFNADRFLFPNRLKNRLLLEVVRQDDDIQNSHYAGTTSTGLKAFWSGELAGDIALVFDSSEGIIIDQDPKFWCGKGRRAFYIEVGGRLGTNLVIKNTEAIVPITIIAGQRTRAREVSCLLDRGTGSYEETSYFADKSHKDLVEEFRGYLEMHEPLIGSPHLEITQALNDRGTDLLLQREGCKLGFQIKSHYDVSQDDFSANVKRQLAESHAHGLDRWYLLICSPLQYQEHDYSGRIAYLLNELSTYKTDYVEAYGPRNTIKYFNSPTPLSTEDFHRKLFR